MKIEVLKENDRNLFYTFYNTQKDEESHLIDRFFKDDFIASEFIIHKDSDVILCAIQVSNEVLFFDGYNNEVNVIKDVIISKNCPKEKAKRFISKVLDSFKYIKLMTLCPHDLLENEAFDDFFKKKRIKVNRRDLYNIEGYMIDKYEEDISLIDVYKQFTSRFNSYVLKTEEDIKRLMLKELENNSEIYVVKNQEDNVMGYVVYSFINGRILVKELIYLDTISLLALLNQAMGLNDFIFVDVSMQESFKKVLGDLEYKLLSDYKVMINDEELFERLYNVKVTSMEKFKKDGKRPYYLGIY